MQRGYVLLILILAAINLYGLNKTEFIEKNGDLVISRIEVSGLKKTKYEIIEKYIATDKSIRISEFNENNLIQNLRELDIFNRDISVEYYEKNKEAIVSIEVEEKITFIPLPFFSYTSDGASGGLFLMETNLLGYEKKLFAGAVFSREEQSVSAGYIDPAFFGTDLNFGLFGGTYITSVEDSMDGENIYRKYKTNNNSLKSFIAFPVTDYLSFRLNTGYETADIDEGFDDKLLSPEDLGMVSYGVGLEYRDIYYNNIFNEGIFIKTNARNKMITDGHEDDYLDLEFEMFFNKAVSRNSIVKFFSTAKNSEAPAPVQERISGKEAFKSLPAEQVGASKYYSCSFSYELAVLFLNWGSFTVFGAYEAGSYKNDIADWTDFYGPGTGFRMYLKKIALPAMGLDLYYNQKTEAFESSFSIGFSM